MRLTLEPLNRRFEMVTWAVILAGVCGILSARLVAQDSGVVKGNFREQQIGQITFQLPRELSIESVASSPLVERPIVATWDEKGRLLVLEAAGVIEREKEAQGARPHRLVRLVDENHDGVFDRRIVAAENLSFPVGVLSVGNSILVSAPPQIWRLIDEDGDGICERREVWLDPGTATHCYNDLHGPYRGRDGWIYWTKGTHAEQSLTERNGKTFFSQAAHIYRRKLEGGPIEIMMTGGMDNPVEVAFSYSGERLFTSTFLQHPGGGRRDGIAHAVYGGVYGKEHNPIDGHWRTGPLMPIMTHLGPAAPSGLLTAQDRRLIRDASLFATAPDHVAANDEFLIAAQFNLQRVSVHRLVAVGTTYRTEDRDLLIGDRIDFHPTDVLEDADGSLLVFDTGGWYNLCCPSMAVDQAEALGGIYRISSQATRARNDPRGLNLGWSQMDLPKALELLASESWWIRKQAINWLEENPAKSQSSLTRIFNDRANAIDRRLDALWCLCRIGNELSARAIIAGLKDPEPVIRHASASAISVHRWPAETELIEMLDSEKSIPVQRVAFEALGRIGTAQSTTMLMGLATQTAKTKDRILEHSLYYALIELGQTDVLAEYLSSEDTNQRKAALRVLAELKSEKLSPSRVFAAVADSELCELALEILEKRPEWAGELAEPLSQLWSRAINSEQDRQALVGIVGKWASQADLQPLLNEKAKQSLVASLPEQCLYFEVLNGIRLKSVPVGWSEPLAGLLASELPHEMKLGLAKWLSAMSLDSNSDKTLIAVLGELAEAEQDNLPAAITFAGCRPDRARLLPNLVDSFISSLFDPAQSQLHAELAGVLKRLQLTPVQARQLLDRLNELDIVTLPSAIAAIASAQDEALDHEVLDALLELKAGKSVPIELLQNLYRERSPKLQEHVAGIVERISQPPESARQVLDELERRLPAGEPLRGMQVFRSTKAACAACHQVAYVGGTSGPDLSRIGSTRTERELLDAIVFPSNRIEQSYQSIKVQLTDGRVFNGLVERQDSTTLELITGPDQRIRLALTEIEERQPSTVSVMPTGIHETLSDQQLADLLAFLESRR